MPNRYINVRPRSLACHGCGITIAKHVKGNMAGSHCSRQCFFDSQALVKREREALQRIAHKAQRKPCEQCGASMLDANPAAKTCSDKCRRVKDGHLPLIRKCRTCGIDFIRAAKTKRGPKCFCSDACQSGRGRIYAVRRAKLLRHEGAERIDKIEVFKQAGWCCQVCRTPTPRSLLGSKRHDNSPELDHIVPLSRGGKHVWSNVRCACRRCNHSKRAKLDSEWLVAA